MSGLVQEIGMANSVRPEDCYVRNSGGWTMLGQGMVAVSFPSCHLV